MTAAPALALFVDGLPRPQGSLDPHGTANGRVRFSHPKLLLAWRATVIDAVQAALPEGWEPVPAGSPVAVQLAFRFERPRRHYTRRGELRPDAPDYMATGTDLDKLVRAIFDALTIAGVWADDKQVAIERSEKMFSERPGVQIRVWRLAE